MKWQNDKKKVIKQDNQVFRCNKLLLQDIFQEVIQHTLLVLFPFTELYDMTD